MLKKNTKGGSYIVEATIVAPVFIIAVLMLVSIVPIIGTIENINYIAVDELSLEDVKSNFRDNPLAYPGLLEHRVLNENKKINSFNIDLYKYKYSAKGIDDLIAVNYSAIFSEKNPLGLFSSINFKGKILSRAYTGKLNRLSPSSRDEFEENKESKIVLIFPTWGERYHNEGCTYVKSNCKMVFLSQNLKKDYSPCKLCKSKNADIGSPVFCFTNSGDVYHNGECKLVDKYYVEIEKEEAIKKGYTPCSKCGGE